MMDHVSVMEPTYPSIAIHKGWSLTPKRKISKPGSIESSTATPSRGRRTRAGSKPRKYGFVNTTTLDQAKDPAMRTMVKRHVRNEFLRTKSSSTAGLLSDISGVPVNKFHQVDVINEKEERSPRKFEHGVPSSLGFPTALCMFEYAIEMKPRMHALLSKYLTFAGQTMHLGRPRMLSQPPKTQGWFTLAVADPAMLHAMMYSGAVCLALLQGRTESQDSLYHLHETISVINKRLNTSIENIDDSTIGALSCVALGEAIAGNKAAWKTHMRGLKSILGSHMNISLDSRFTAKLHRTDITGAIDYAEMPHLDFVRSNSPHVWSALPQSELDSCERDLVQMLSLCQIHLELIDLMVDVAWFSTVLISWRSNSSLVIDVKTLLEDMYWIQYRLLRFPTTAQYMVEPYLNEACRLGALLYMKILLEEFPHSAAGSSILLEKLHKALQNIKIDETQLGLVLWLSLIGAALSKSAFKGCFMEILEHVTMELKVLSFHDHNLEMSKVLSLEKVQGSSIDKIWLKVQSALESRRTYIS